MEVNNIKEFLKLLKLSTEIYYLITDFLQVVNISDKKIS